MCCGRSIAGSERLEFATSRLSDVETMHAMTIHKCQGSQADEVTVLMPPEDSRLLTRELFYTAVTRAKDKVRVVGPEASVRAAVERRAVRASGLARRHAGLPVRRDLHRQGHQHRREVQLLRAPRRQRASSRRASWSARPTRSGSATSTTRRRGICRLIAAQRDHGPRARAAHRTQRALRGATHPVLDPLAAPVRTPTSGRSPTTCGC